MFYFILNPSSHSRGDRQIWPQIRQILHQRGIDHQVCATRHSGHATELAREISTRDPGATIVVIGGDGSIHEVLNGLTNLGDVTLGVIPHGSGNDFANGMGISEDPIRALEAILHPAVITRMDVGRVTQDHRSLRFGVSAGIGFDAAVCHEALSSKIKDSLNALSAGKLTYTAIAAKQILLYDPGTVRLRLDGGRVFTYRKTYFVAVMNQRFEGGGLMMSPEAVADDGVLDVFVCAGISKAELVSALPLARYGLHTKYRGIHFLRCSSVEILADRKLPIHLDGESGGIGNTLRAGLEPERLKVIVK